jgi:hypothetical protein
MVCFYPSVSRISVKPYRITDAFSNRFFIHLEIVFTPFGLLYIKDCKTVPLNYDLGFQRVPLLIRFLSFFRTIYRAFRHIYHDILN